MPLGRRFKVLVVDDSAMFRRVLTTGLSTDPMIDVIGSASSPMMARDMIAQQRPDVITLDLEMPGMNGVDFLRSYMATSPIPTVVISSRGQVSEKATVDALEAGAVDVFAKPAFNASTQSIETMMADIIQRVKGAALSRPGKVTLSSIAAANPVASNLVTSKDWVIAIGSSTGGVQALAQVLPNFPAEIPGIVMVQHMPEGFTTSFAKRLNSICKISVREAQDGDFVEPGVALLAPGGDRHMEIRRIGKTFRVVLTEGPQVCFSRPSVDVLFNSVARETRGRCSAAILTGMGRDGAEGMLKIKSAAGRTFAQDEASSVVFGMPLAAWNIGAAEKLVPLDKIANTLTASVGQSLKKSQAAKTPPSNQWAPRGSLK